ncbi:MAG: RluA family pseudouridine synthase [Alphaproteobacteria bacterium]
MSTGAPKTYRVAVDKLATGERLDRLLAARLPSLSRSRIKALIVAGQVAATGQTIVEPSYRVKHGQTFAIIVPEATPAHPEGQDIALTILHEDPHLLVLDKPAGLVVHPAPGNPDRTLVNALIAHCGPSLRGIGGVRRPGIVHRLDKDTSGLMVVAKTEPAHQGLSRQFAAREIERRYHAVVWGVPEPRAGEISGNIGRSPRNRKKMAVLRRGGKAAITRYRVLSVLADGLASLIECRLLSGRTHQIRVHMSHIGHPLLGDRVYGRAGDSRVKRLPAAAQTALADLGRQALHAKTLGFRHPVTLEDIRYESELPLDIKTLKSSLETQ